MRRHLALLLIVSAPALAAAQQPFTLQQILGQPYSTALTAAPAGTLFAWVENTEGRHNLWISDLRQPRQLTHNSEDDGLEISEIAWSPDATAIAYTYGAELGADHKPANPAHLPHPTADQIIVQPIAPGAPSILIGDGHSPLYTHDGHLLLFIRDGQVWSANLQSHPIQLQQLVSDTSPDSDLTLSPDDALLAFISHREQPDHTSHTVLGLFDLRNQTLRLGPAATGDDSAPAFSLDGKHLAWLHAPPSSATEFQAARTADVPWSIQLLDVATGKAIPLFSPEAGQPGSVLPHMSTGDPRLFWTINNEIVFASEADGWVQLYELNPAHPGNMPDQLTQGNFEVEDPAVSADGRILVFASNQSTNDLLDTDRRHIWRLNLENDGATPFALTHGPGIATHPQVSADGQTVVALVSDAAVPMHPALLSSAGQPQSLRPHAFTANSPALQLSAPLQVLFPSADRLFTLHGQIFFPAHFNPQVPHPAILFFHGGPERQMLLGYPSMDYYSYAYAMNQYLASRGFLVMSVNYRCGIGYGLNFRECEHCGAAGATEYNDVLGAVQYLRSAGFVDPKRIGIWGGSYGGYLTALALARNSNLFAAGVDFSGIYDWMLEDDRAKWLRGTPAEQQQIAALAHTSSPIASIDHWSSPVLLIQGDQDADVAFAQTTTLAAALRTRNLPVEELVFPGEVHDFLLYRDWISAYQAAAAFFERTLHPVLDSTAVPQQTAAAPIAPSHAATDRK